MAVLYLGGPIAVAGLSIAAIAVVVGRRLYRSHPTEMVLTAWTITVFSHAVSVQFGRGTPLAGLIKQVDEPMVMLLLVLTLIERRRAAARPLILVPAAGLLCAGLASNIIQATPVMPAIVGGWSGLKFWVLLFITISLPWRRRDFELLSRWTTAVVALVLGIAMVELVAPALHRTVLPVRAFGAELRFGRAGLQSVFTHPDHFGSFSTLFGAFFLGRFVATGQRKHLGFGLACVTLGILSLRVKVVLGLVAALAVLATSAARLFVRRLGLAVLVAVFFVATAGGIVADLTTQQLDRYVFGETVTVRQSLYEAGREIAIDNFPFGAGFGRYGSGASTTYNSPVYEQYDLTRAGLTQENPGVRHDTTWPTVVGEAGVFGLIFFIGGLAALGLRLHRFGRSNDPLLREWSLGAIAVLAAVFVESVARPSFFNAISALTVAVLVGGPIELGERRRRERQRLRFLQIAPAAPSTAPTPPRASASVPDADRTLPPPIPPAEAT